MASRELVVIQDGMLASMARNEKFTSEFPFLKSLNGFKKKGCCRGADRRRAQAFQSAKRQIAALSSDKRQKLKQLLNTDKVRVLIRQSNGKVSEITF